MGEHSTARERWFARLRDRFLTLAARRVPPDAVEDVVQEALRVVHAKGRSLPDDTVDGMPPVAWCFQVLRNVIGNHYQRARTRSVADPEAEREATGGTARVPTPLEALESRDIERHVRESVAQLATTDGNCGRYLRSLLSGHDPAGLARQEAIPAASLYRRLYRCRQKLRALLERKGILT